MGCLCFGNSRPAEPSPASAYQLPAAPKAQPDAKQEAATLPPAVLAQSADSSFQATAAIPPWQKDAILSTYKSGGLPSSASVPEKASESKSGMAVPNLAEVLRLNLGEVKLVLQKLASLNSTPTIALNEASELLQKHLSVGLCSITGLTDHCTSFVLLAAYGVGAHELERTPVMRGPQWSAAHLLQQPVHLYLTAKNDAEAVQLPLDFQALYKYGLRSFLSIPIATDHEVLSVLTIAKEDVDGFEVEWWEPMLGCLSTGLLYYLRSEQTQNLCQLMRNLDASPDYTNVVHQLLRGAHSLLLRATNIRTGCRLALLPTTDLSRALIFEPDRTMSAAEAYGTAPLPGDARDSSPQIHVTEIQLENTLLLDAVQKGKARFVSDCASYIQSCMKPATDIFISGQEMVASIVVLPLIFDGVTFGGFYVTLETTSNFQNIKDLLMGLVNSVVLLLAKRLQPQRDQIWDSILTRGGPATLDDRERLDTMTASQAAGGQQGDSVYLNSEGIAKPVVVKRSCTEAMLKVLQHELRKTHAKTAAQHEWIEELTLTEIVGKGGFGVVYKGTFKGSVAAVKIMYARQHERQAMKDALEMAVLTTVSHPHIIQVFNCFTDMVEDASGTNSPSPVEGRINVRFRRLQPDEDRSLATCNILVMEYCDKASLRHAMKKGVFHKRLGNTSVAVDLCAIVQVLIEVSQAIQHLHSLKLIHCDIKPENVLLKSDGSKPIGFVTKLSDFGLAKLLRENYYIVNRSGSGTVTHLAPELFQVGSKLTTSVDTFSFGIMMWELYTGQRAVYKKKARPIFPLGVPQQYATLAKSCWDNDPSSRPPFSQVLLRLAEMLASFTSASMSPPPGMPPSPAAPAQPSASPPDLALAAPTPGVA
ncbi:putative serine/threonine-protein kinase [Tetrabaena socialis]|uniref:Putative serine/threonine-protein kinase n=1 Tax=Tetrabaena socialis TaxID=47790 RepID=A0A2J7ZT42_9CHLO|nr:putative serine/threonine-protein kinase [Tetrabaena socialis]|eukprot:PNH03437.1 putative serine/threonine-protein kinase [Tetrabaena socialis]